jgi:hypothetical protein
VTRRPRLLVVLAVLSAASHTFATGVFEVAQDIGGLSGAGSTEFLGYSELDGKLVGRYLITSYGGDTGGTRDRFHFAYRRMTGALRLSAAFEWVGSPDGSVPAPGSKYGVMIRAAETPDAVNYFTASQKDGALVQMTWRPATGAGSSETQVGASTVPGATRPHRLGIQRVLIGGQIPALESLVDWGRGAGWERVGALQLLPALPEEVLVGVAVGSGNVGDAAQALASDVVYETKAELVGPAPEFPRVPAPAAMASAPAGAPGFKIRTLKALYTEGWGRTEMTKLLDFGCTGPICMGPGLPIPAAEQGERVSAFVNLHDTGGRGAFSADNGFPDESFPGVDPFESPTADPAAGDDDDHLATEVTAIVELTAGYHVFAVNDDDGTIFEVGGIEIGRSAESKGASNTGFVFQVEADGFYPLRARHLEGRGSAELELHEVIKAPDGSWRRVLLGDVAGGGVAVFSAP